MSKSFILRKKIIFYLILSLVPINTSTVKKNNRMDTMIRREIFPPDHRVHPVIFAHHLGISFVEFQIFE